MHINYSSFFIHCRAKQTAQYVYPELNAIQLIPRSFIHAPYNLFLVLSPLPSQTKKYFGHWVLKWLAYKRWQTDIPRWRTDFIRWPTGRWWSFSLAKRPVFLGKAIWFSLLQEIKFSNLMADHYLSFCSPLPSCLKLFIRNFCPVCIGRWFALVLYSMFMQVALGSLFLILFHDSTIIFYWIECCFVSFLEIFLFKCGSRFCFISESYTLNLLIFWFSGDLECHTLFIRTEVLLSFLPGHLCFWTMMITYISAKY